ncbi:MAG TPA: hypothetical protein VGB30_05130 [bacterium]|jgi:hypothetical protein
MNNSSPKSDFRTELSNQWVLLLIVGIVLVLNFSFTLRGPQPTWADEAFTLRLAATDSWTEFWHEIKLDVHPPLYFALAKIVSDDAGESREYLKYSPPGPRALAYIIYFSLIWFTLALWKKRVSNIYEFLMPALLLVGSAHLSLFGPMMRYYCISGLFVTVAALYLLPETEGLDQEKTRGWLPPHIKYSIFLLLAFAANYLTIVIIPAHIRILTGRKKEDSGPYLKSMGGALVLAIPLLALGAYQTVRNIGSVPDMINLTAGFIARIIYSVYSFSMGEFIQPWMWIASIPASISMLVLFYAVWTWRKTAASSLLFHIFAVSLLLGAFIVSSLGIGLEFSPSRLFFLCPLFLILLGYSASRSITQNNGKYITIIALSILILSNIVSSYNYSKRQGFIQSTYIIPWQQIADDIGVLESPGQLINFSSPTVEHYISVGPDYFQSSSIDPISTKFPVYVILLPQTFTNTFFKTYISTIEEEYELDRELKYVEEDVTSLRFKSMLLRRQVEPVKMVLQIYTPADR